MLSKVKALLSKPLFYKNLHGGRNRAFLIIPAFLILLLTPLITGYSQILQPNPDSIPFAPAVNYPVGDFPTSIFCVDLDNDTDLDLAVANWSSNNVFILKNDGDGTFASAVNYGAGGWPRSLFCAYLDGDGNLDVAVANWSSDSVSILKNDGHGAFPSAVNYGAGDGPSSVFCADLDGDSNLDLAVANTESDSVSILRNNGDGTFQSAVNYGAGDHTHSVFCADLDGDGDLDLAVASYESDSVSILLNLSNLARPYSFALISPDSLDSIKTTDYLIWQKAIDLDTTDTVRYALYLSRLPNFYPDSMVYDSALDTTFTDTIGIGLWYWKVKAYDEWGAVRWSNQTWSFYVYLCGDCNRDGLVELGDVVHLISYLYKSGPAPVPLLAGDCNCDEEVQLGDVVYLISYLYKSGDAPCKNCK